MGAGLFRRKEMTTPLTPPTFSGSFDVKPTDIGAGYAAGITSAGQSIAGAIGAVMGGYNAKTGELQEGILDQKKSSEDTLDMLHTHGVIDDATYEKAKTSSLGAQQKMIGISTAEFNTKLQAQLEQQRALAVTAAQNQGAMARTVTSEQGATGRTEAQIRAQIEAEKLKIQQNPANRFVLPPKAANAPVPIPNKLSLNTGY
jgi:hypothetical protein